MGGRRRSPAAVLSVVTPSCACSRFEEVLEDAVKSQALKRPRESVEVDSATEKKLTKAEKRKAKKLKSEGDAAAVPAGSAAASIPPTKAEKEKSEKQDTPAKGEKPAPKPAKAATVDLPDGVKYVNSKIGTGPQAKSGNTVSVRYIGKLANGKIFDKNTKGKPACVTPILMSPIFS
jgi:FK506-binding nuclear protein